MPYKAKVSIPIIVIAVIGIITASSIYSYTYTARIGPPTSNQAPGMMGEGPWTDSGSQSQGSLTIDDTLVVTQDYLNYLGSSNLAVAEIMEFSNHFYVDVYEKNTGIHAFELIIERDGDLYPEHGPNMMWNTKYGHHNGGMMGGGGMMGTYSESAQMPITEDESIVYAQKYLGTYVVGTTAVEPHRFYGYYTLHVEKGGNIIGMLSVNGYSGDVWYHNWHGEFIQIVEFEEHEG